MKSMRIKNIIIIGILSMAFAQNAWAGEYEKYFEGTWVAKSMTDKGAVSYPPPGKAMHWTYKLDGTGNVKMTSSENKRGKIIRFTWQIQDNNKIKMKFIDNNDEEVLHFGFFEDSLLLMKKPHDTIRLQKIKSD